MPDTKFYDGTSGSAGTPIVMGGLAAGDRFATLGQEYTTTGIGTGLTLVPNVAIDDGNGGANCLLTMATA